MKRKLTPLDIDALIASHQFIRPEKSTLTLCVMELSNGCTVVGKSNVIDPQNYDEKLGEAAAYNNAREQIWQLEGYAMKRDMLKRPEMAARVAHEVNRIWCESVGDMSQKPWDFAPDWAQDSAVVGAMEARDKPDATPEKMHECWLKHKLENGWVYGDVKDSEAKTHPCMVPYSELPADQQIKDRLFLEINQAIYNT